MKILFVASNLQALGGIQAYNRKLLKVMEELKVNVKIVEAKSTSRISKAVLLVNSFLGMLFFGPDIVMLTNLNYGPLGLFAKKFFKKPFTIAVYGVEVQNIKNQTQLAALKEAKFIIKLFEETARNVLRQIPEAKDKILTIPNSVDGKRFYIKEKRADLLQKFGLRDKKIILTIGRMSQLDGDNKGYKRVIKALPEVLKKVPNAVYLLAGTGDDLPNVQKLIKELNLESKVIMPGPVKEEEMADFYNLADVFILPSKNEGFPAIVLLEALACGTPVLGGAQPGVKESFDGKYGVIVEPDDVGQIADGLIGILSGNVPENIKNGEWLRSKVLEEYGEEAYKNAVIAVLRTLEK
jgi:glycosyltransferase involved in cell wall biosynthesis